MFSYDQRSLTLSILAIAFTLLSVSASAQSCSGQPLRGDTEIARFYQEGAGLPTKDISNTQDNERLRKLEVLFNRGAFYYGQTYDNAKALYAISATRAVLQEQTPRFHQQVVKDRLLVVANALDQMSKDVVAQAFNFTPDYTFTDLFENNICDRDQFVDQAKAARKEQFVQFDRTLLDAQLHEIYCAWAAPPIGLKVLLDPPNSPPCMSLNEPTTAPTPERSIHVDEKEQKSSSNSTTRPETVRPVNQPLPNAAPGTAGEIWLQIVLLVILALIFFALMLLIIYRFAEPTDMQAVVFRLALALLAAGFGSVIPGVIHLKSGAVQAGGAAAFFVLVYLINPPKLASGHVAPGHKPRREGRPSLPNDPKSNRKMKNDQPQS